MWGPICRQIDEGANLPRICLDPPPPPPPHTHTHTHTPPPPPFNPYHFYILHIPHFLKVWLDMGGGGGGGGGVNNGGISELADSRWDILGEEFISATIHPPLRRDHWKEEFNVGLDFDAIWILSSFFTTGASLIHHWNVKHWFNFVSQTLDGFIASGDLVCLNLSGKRWRIQIFLNFIVSYQMIFIFLHFCIFMPEGEV